MLEQNAGSWRTAMAWPLTSVQGLPKSRQLGTPDLRPSEADSMAERVSRRSFIEAAGAAAVGAALPATRVDPSVVKLTPPRLLPDGRAGALRDTAHLYARPS
jgi:hypothetical protein